MELRVGAVMRREPDTISVGERLAIAVALLATSNSADLMVIDSDKRFIGVLSEGDILRYLMPDAVEFRESGLLNSQKLMEGKAADLLDLSIDQFIISSAIVLAPQDTLIRAAAVMVNMQIRCLPVVEDSVLVGSLSRSRLIHGILTDH